MRRPIKRVAARRIVEGDDRFEGEEESQAMECLGKSTKSIFAPGRAKSSSTMRTSKRLHGSAGRRTGTILPYQKQECTDLPSACAPKPGKRRRLYASLPADHAILV